MRPELDFESIRLLRFHWFPHDNMLQRYDMIYHIRNTKQSKAIK